MYRDRSTPPDPISTSARCGASSWPSKRGDEPTMRQAPSTKTTPPTSAGPSAGHPSQCQSIRRKGSTAVAVTREPCGPSSIPAITTTRSGDSAAVTGTAFVPGPGNDRSHRVRPSSSSRTTKRSRSCWIARSSAPATRNPPAESRASAPARASPGREASARCQRSVPSGSSRRRRSERPVSAA